MELLSDLGDSIALTIAGYQYPDLTGSPAAEFDWDANWLEIEGRIVTGGHGWTFRQPWLTTLEAREVSAWLRAVVDGTDLPFGSGFWAEDLEEPGALDFLEPYLTFVCTERSAERAVIRVLLTGEAAGSAPNDPRPALISIDLQVSREALIAAAAAWDAQLRDYPVRP